MTEKSLKEINFKELCSQQFFPSPAAWEDEVLYFLMLDRFSDNKEANYFDNQGEIVKVGQTPPFKQSDQGNAISNQNLAKKWSQAGTSFVGGNLKGLESKIGYLKRLGISAIWISPVFKQAAYKETYHGYGIQNFLDIDPHFGKRSDLKTMVQAAHANGIRVILDIIINHSGDVFEYKADRYYNEKNDTFDPRWDNSPYQVKGFRNKSGKPSISFGQVKDQETWPDGAVWPREFQKKGTFTCKGRINNWDNNPEYLEGDFFDLKDIQLGKGHIDNYSPSPALSYLCEVYKFWIAYADIDGFRIDTVKHMEKGATRYFVAVIHEFAQSIGKENFYLIGEITGGRQNAFNTLEETGLNAALGINDIPDKIEYLIKGQRNPREYFDLFRNSLLVKKDSHVWFKNKVVTTFDDHDQVRKGDYKARFAYNESSQTDNKKLLLPVLAFTITTLGIPCIYYGTEQSFDGHGNNDRYIREAMFGGEFGAFESRGKHCFNEENPIYQELAKILQIRKEHIALRRGRQYLRPISGNGYDFGLPHKIGNHLHSIIPWSRIFNNKEILLAVNTNPNETLLAWVTIDNYLHPKGDALKCIYSKERQQIGHTVYTEEKNGKAVLLTIPAAGFVIYE